jgi:flagellar assembly protein FliH
MTSIAHRYHDFGKELSRAEAEAQSAQATEEESLEAFERGYQAGWDDAAAAHESEQAKATSELSQKFQELSFTYHEAYAKLALSIKPLMTKFVTTLLPEVAHHALGAQIMAEVEKLLDINGEGALEIAVAPENLEQMTELLSSESAPPFAIVEEPTLSAGQVYIRVNSDERQINLDAVLTAVTDAVEAFFDSAEKEAQHG